MQDGSEQLTLSSAAQDILERAETTLPPEGGFPCLVDDYFIEKLKEDEMKYSYVDHKHYEGLREIIQKEMTPLYNRYFKIREQIAARKQKRSLAGFVFGTIAVLELLELLLTKGRSLIPTILIPTVIMDGFIGFALYALIQYKDDMFAGFARKKTPEID